MWIVFVHHSIILLSTQPASTLSKWRWWLAEMSLWLLSNMSLITICGVENSLRTTWFVVITNIHQILKGDTYGDWKESHRMRRNLWLFTHRTESIFATINRLLDGLSLLTYVYTCREKPGKYRIELELRERNLFDWCICLHSAMASLFALFGTTVSISFVFIT